MSPVADCSDAARGAGAEHCRPAPQDLQDLPLGLLQILFVPAARFALTRGAQNPEEGGKPTYQEYKVDMNECVAARSFFLGHSSLLIDNYTLPM